jgi:hypothetical protein
METHGGFGKLYGSCYTAAATGVVFETDAMKAGALAKQRPHWAVYEGDAVAALEHGGGAHLEVNVLDLDPDGSCWPVMDAFFDSQRPRAARLALVVNDGLRQMLAMNGGWSVAEMHSSVVKYGNHALYERYLEACRDLVMEKAARQGYSLRHWTGYYCGMHQHMTHFAAILER